MTRGSSTRRSPRRRLAEADLTGLAARLRAAGSVWAEEEAEALLSVAAGAALEGLVRRRLEGEPLEHLLGFVDFGGIRLAVGPGAFVPRRRSRFLARAAVRVVREQAADPGWVPVVLEAYAGVAPIASTVATALPDVEVHAAELDPVAAGFARRNLPTGEVHVGAGLAALPERLRGRLSLIAAVPPYIPEGERHLVPRDALAHEPSAALFAGADGLDEVRRLAEEGRAWMRSGARMLLELNRQQAPAASAAARRSGYRSRIRRSGDGQTAVLDLRLD